MHEEECSTSSPNQFKPSFCISECGRIHRYSAIHIYSMAPTKQNLSEPFQILNSVVVNTNNLRGVDFAYERVGMLVGNFELRPLKETNHGVAQDF